MSEVVHIISDTFMLLQYDQKAGMNQVFILYHLAISVNDSLQEMIRDGEDETKRITCNVMFALTIR